MGTRNTGGAQTGTVASLNLNNGSQTVVSLTVQSDSNSPNTITIGTGETLAVNATTGNSLVVGVDPISSSISSITHLVVSGAGALSVTNTSGNMLVGVPTVPTTENTASNANLDLTNLTGGFTYSAGPAGTGQLLIGTDTGTGSTGGTNPGNFLRLSNTTNTITAAAISVGNNIHAMDSTLLLGTGVNNINVGTINVAGVSGAGRRGNGAILFNAAGGSGTTRFRNQAGTGAGGAQHRLEFRQHGWRELLETSI